MGVTRLELRLANQAEWIKIFDPRDWTVFVGTSETIANGTGLRIDLDVGGWLVTLRGTVVGKRESPAGVIVALGGTERDKINYLNGFVRGGLLNLREKRRLPLRLAVTYGAVEGPANTFTKDINEEGVFLFTDKPLPETSQVHMLVTVPGKTQPLSLTNLRLVAANWMSANILQYALVMLACCMFLGVATALLLSRLGRRS